MIKEALHSINGELNEQLIVSLGDFTHRSKLTQALVDEPPVTLREGGVFAGGYSEELNQLRKVTSHSANWLAELEQADRERAASSP